MKLIKCKCIFFSPTGTTKSIVNKIADGIGIYEKDYMDFTKSDRFNPNNSKFEKHELVIIGVPVYAGRIPIVAEKFINNFKTDEIPAVIIVTYGNREYEDALMELKNTCEKTGFKIIAAGAFIGEHSMSSKRNPIAQGRPDKSDLNKAYDFGIKIKQKINNIKNLFELNILSIPGNNEYIKRKKMPQLVPKTNNKKCILCLKCILICPISIIKKYNSEIKTNKNNCILCCACIKICPVKARKIKSILFSIVINKLYNMCRERKEPEIYL